MNALWTSAEATQAVDATPAGAWNATGVSIDSRTVRAGDLFVALVGPNNDGHDYVAAAFERGAAAALVSKPVAGADPAKLLAVADTQAALEALGRAARERTAARVIAVTGSVGKTSTKEALRTALGALGPTHASEASYNNLWGVPLTLARMPRETAYGVFEIGMNHADEIRPLVAQVRPDAAIVTTVEAVHLENFASVEGIADAKAEIFEGLRPGGVAIVNADNPHAARLTAAATRGGAKVWTFGERGAEARLVSVALHDDGSDVVAEIAGETIAYRYGAPGRHHVQNSLAVLLGARALDADWRAAAAALGRVEAVKGRGQRRRVALEDGEFELIDESYNANPVSMASALSLLAGAKPAPGGRRIAVLGDMLELGPDSAAMHAGLAEPISRFNADRVFASGPMMSHLWAALPVPVRGAYAQSSTELAPLVAAETRAGDVVMVKGSLGSRMAKVVDALLARGRPDRAS